MLMSLTVLKIDYIQFSLKSFLETSFVFATWDFLLDLVC